MSESQPKKVRRRVDVAKLLARFDPEAVAAEIVRLERELAVLRGLRGVLSDGVRRALARLHRRSSGPPTSRG